MSCVEEPTLESRTAPPAPPPAAERAAVERVSTSRSVAYAQRVAGANGGAGGAPGSAPVPQQSAESKWATGPCKTIVANSVKALGDTALAMGIGATVASKVPAPALYGVAVKFVTNVAADGVAALSCDRE
jgi:hypothetical protein